MPFLKDFLKKVCLEFGNVISFLYLCNKGWKPYLCANKEFFKDFKLSLIDNTVRYLSHSSLLGMFSIRVSKSKGQAQINNFFIFLST